MSNFLKKSTTWAFSIITVVFTFVPEMIFQKYKLLSNANDGTNIVLIRILAFIGILILSIIINALYLLLRRKVQIKGHNYSIQVEYGDLLEMNSCKKVIHFDECFTTSVGDAPSEVKPSSICGQYLSNNPIQDMESLINNAHLKPAKSKSKYQNKVRYDSGKLGSGLTRIDSETNASLTQQELLDIIIYSYKLSRYKIKPPCQLRIICKKNANFSLNKIGTTL